ncbi:hypothetical protein Tco_1531463 [Tanacetum coccineum]
MANENEKIGASGSAIVDENRGRDDVRQNPKKRGMSKDIVASLDQRVIRSWAEITKIDEWKGSLEKRFTLHQKPLKSCKSRRGAMHESLALKGARKWNSTWNGVNKVDDASRLRWRLDTEVIPRSYGGDVGYRDIKRALGNILETSLEDVRKVLEMCRKARKVMEALEASRKSVELYIVARGSKNDFELRADLIEIKLPHGKSLCRDSPWTIVCLWRSVVSRRGSERLLALAVSAELEYRGVANVVAETCLLRNLLHLVAAGQVRLLHVPSRYQHADIFIKGLPSALFEEFRTSLSVRCPLAQTAGEC